MAGNENIGKPFAHVRIEWTVENFCLAARDAGTCIYSSEFLLKGDYLTKWIMILQIDTSSAVTSRTVPILFTLERRPEVAYRCDTVSAKCELIVKAGNRRFPVGKKLLEFKEKDQGSMIFPNLESILDNFKPFTADTLKIEFNMIVRSRGNVFQPYEQSSEGLCTLSKDLECMFLKSNYYDITIDVDGKQFKAHKFMLNRIDYFRRMLSRIPDEDILRLRNESYENICKFVTFIYTGNMFPILNYPSLAMYKLLQKISCDMLLRYFVPDRLSMNTAIELEEGPDIHWTIDNFSQRKAEILSRPYRFCSQLIWRMRFIPFSFKSNKCYISLFVEVLSWKKPTNACLDFGLLGSQNCILFSRRLVKANMNAQNEGFPYFIDRNELKSRSLVHDDDTIHIVFRPRIPAYKNKHSLVARNSPTVTLPERTSYEQLSAHMVSLLEGNECDLTIVVGDEIFHAHRSVLEARCNKFRQCPLPLEESQSVVIRDITAPIFRKFLDFIYGGVLMDCDFQDLVHMYLLGNSYGVKGLAEQVRTSFAEKITPENKSQLQPLLNRYTDNKLVQIFHSC